MSRRMGIPKAPSCPSSARPACHAKVSADTINPKRPIFRLKIVMKEGGSVPPWAWVAKKRFTNPVSGIAPAATMFTRLSFGTVWTAKLRHSSTSDASAEAASTKLAHVPTQTTPHKTWIHRAAVLSDIAASLPFSTAAAILHAVCERRARPGPRPHAGGLLGGRDLWHGQVHTEVRLPC